MERKESRQNQISKWLSIWVDPRETLSKILKENPRRYTLLLAIISGLLAALASWFYLIHTEGQDGAVKTPSFLIFILFLGGVAGAIHLYFGAWLYGLIGRMLNGKAGFIETKCAVGWSCYPFAVANIFNALKEAYSEHFVLLVLFTTIYFILVVWAFVIFLKLLGEAHRFSSWRALATLLFSAFVILLAFVLISVALHMLKPLFNASLT